MKRYILEIDRDQIWSYEAEDANAKIKFTLIRSHGDATYWLEDGFESYWKWFEGVVSPLPETVIDMCFLYETSAKGQFEGLLRCMPDFKKPTETSWRLTELQTFFHVYRENHQSGTIEYLESTAMFHSSDGQTLCVSGVGSFHLLNDVPIGTPTKELVKKEEILTTTTQQTATQNTIYQTEELKPPIRKPKIKVYGPNKTFFPSEDPQKNEPLQRKESIGHHPSPAKSAQKRKQAPKIDKEPTEKIGADDLQRFFQKKTEGQCDTVPFSLDSHSE